MVSKRWTVETLNATVDKEFASLPADMRGRYRRVAEIIEEFSLDQVPRNMLRKLRGPIWEIRIRGRDGISRALYVTARERRVIVLRVFVKKSQRTPAKEIELALKRAREVLR